MKYALLLFYLIGISSYSQQGPSGKWTTIQILNDSLGIVEVHIDTSNQKKRKPILLFLEGSGNLPLFFKRSDGRYSSGITLNTDKYAKDYHILLVSKPGIPLEDSLHYSFSGRGYYPLNPEYTELYSLNWRAGAGAIAIDFALKYLKVDPTKVIVMGHSEGSQVAPLVAVKNNSVTHVISMMGNALTQFYDFLMNERLSVLKGDISPIQAQYTIDSLFLEYEKIFSDPSNTSSQWYGETYKKWNSFAVQSPLESMLLLEIPILYIAGGMDVNQNIINMDYARLEFLRKGKKNLTYKVFPTLDHFFQKRYVIASSDISEFDLIDAVHEMALQWVE